MKKITLKRYMSCLLAVSALFALTACGSSSAASQTSSPSQSQETTAPEGSETAGTADTATPSPEESAQPVTDGPDGGTLVVYYSATGNTESVANAIAAATGGDLFELEPVEPYNDADLNWTDDNSRVSVEHDNPDERAVELTASTVDNWDSYDTVYIGYPIWWGIAAWPVDTFVKANDFTGKTVIPFCTAASSGLGESGELLEELAGSGEWLEGQRFRSGASEADVTDWINEPKINQ
ncbi:MAG: flavodoxin [Lachnospiraceae bacterium]|nr:flavodoxin [Lachnospiraceae bacterium]